MFGIYPTGKDHVFCLRCNSAAPLCRQMPVYSSRAQNEIGRYLQNPHWRLPVSIGDFKGGCCNPCPGM